MADDEKMTLKEATKKLAIQSNNGLWSILDNVQPTKEEIEEAIHMAHTARYLWSKVGTIINLVRGDYMIARVYAQANRPEPALHYAQRCLELAIEAEKDDPGFKNWDMPFVYEALARAHVSKGNKDECKKFRDMAQDLTDKLSTREDKKVCQGEIDKIPC